MPNVYGGAAAYPANVLAASRETTSAWRMTTRSGCLMIFAQSRHSNITVTRWQLPSGKYLHCQSISKYTLLRYRRVLGNRQMVHLADDRCAPASVPLSE